KEARAFRTSCIRRALWLSNRRAASFLAQPVCNAVRPAPEAEYSARENKQIQPPQKGRPRCTGPKYCSRLSGSFVLSRKLNENVNVIIARIRGQRTNGNA